MIFYVIRQEMVNASKALHTFCNFFEIIAGLLSTVLEYCPQARRCSLAGSTTDACAQDDEGTPLPAETIDIRHPLTTRYSKLLVCSVYAIT